MSKVQSNFPSSPKWTPYTKLFMVGILFILTLLTFYYFRGLILPLFTALILSYLLQPIIDYFDRKTKLPRWAITAILFLYIIGMIVGLIATMFPSMLGRLLEFANEIVLYIEQISQQVVQLLRKPIVFRGETYTIPIDDIQLNEFEQILGQLVSFLGTSVGNVSDIVTNLTRSMFNIISKFLFMIFIAFHLTKDRNKLSAGLINLAPNGYQSDTKGLLNRLGLIWGAFLRGQLILMLTMGSIVFIVATILGLPYPWALGVLAGLLEIVPYVGPILAAVPAVLLAFFQYDQSWIGENLSAFSFAIIVTVVYWLLQQIENYFLVPRIMGHQLDLHPVLILSGTLMGWQVAGILGILFAAPTLATVKILLQYVYAKIIDRPLDPPPSPPSTESVPENTPTPSTKINSTSA